MIRTNVRRTPLMEAKADQEKTVREWMQSSAASRKVRELLQGEWRVSRKKSPSTVFQIECDAHVKFQCGSNDVSFPATVTARLTEESGLVQVSAVCSEFNFAQVSESEVGRIVDQIGGGFRSVASTDYMVLVDDNTICMKPRVSLSAKQLRGMVTVKDDGIATVSAQGCAELINDAVLTTVNDLEGQCRKILEKYPNTTYKYTSGNGSPTVDAPDFSKAISYLEQIRELAGSAEDEANSLYKGKDVFGGEYKVNAGAVNRSCETMISHLSNFKGQELDGTKSPDRKLLEEASSDTWITEDLESLWRTLCAMDVSLNQFLGSGFSKKAYTDLDFSGMIPSDFYGAETEELETELENLNLMRPAGELVVKILNSMKNNGWVLIHPSTGRNETVFSDVAYEIVKEYAEGEEAETSVRKFNIVYPAPSIEL